MTCADVEFYKRKVEQTKRKLEVIKKVLKKYEAMLEESIIARRTYSKKWKEKQKNAKSVTKKSKQSKDTKPFTDVKKDITT